MTTLTHIRCNFSLISNIFLKMFMCFKTVKNNLFLDSQLPYICDTSHYLFHPTKQIFIQWKHVSRTASSPILLTTSQYNKSWTLWTAQKEPSWTVFFFQNVTQGWVTWRLETWALSEPTQERGRLCKWRMSVILWSVIGDLTQSPVRLIRFCIFSQNKFVSDSV